MVLIFKVIFSFKYILIIFFPLKSFQILSPFLPTQLLDSFSKKKQKPNTTTPPNQKKQNKTTSKKKKNH